MLAHLPVPALGEAPASEELSDRDSSRTNAVNDVQVAWAGKGSGYTPTNLVDELAQVLLASVVLASVDPLTREAILVFTTSIVPVFVLIADAAELLE